MSLSTWSIIMAVEKLNSNQNFYVSKLPKEK